ncbi:MAG: hypothetical protein MJZ00_05180 [Paludibacteraceae bacterium]|nr:hypothetical protein [Paludibacteraceae bacterium]
MLFPGFSRFEEEREETTFWEDFSVADAFGVDAIKETFDSAFEGWKHDYKYLTELSIVLNHKIWQWYGMRGKHKNADPLSRLYDTLWKEVHSFALNTLQNEELSFYCEVTD